MAPLRGFARQLGVRRSLLRGARVRAQRSALAGLRRDRASTVGRILCYHSVGTASWGYNDVPSARFRSHLEIALAAGYRFVSPERIAGGEGEPGELAITFDDALRSVGTTAAPILAEFGIPWAVFVVSDWAAGRNHGFGDVFLTWSELRELAARGATVGSHSVSHPNFGLLDEERARRELLASGTEIREHVGQPVRSFAIPFGQSRDWNPRWTEIAREAGYDIIYAQSVAGRFPGTVPRTFVTRFDTGSIFRAALRGAFDQWEE